MLGFAHTMSPRLRAARLRVRLCSSRRQLELIAKLPDDRPAVLCRNSAELLMGEAPAHRHLWDSVASVEECQRAVEVAQRAMRRCCDNDGDHGKLFPPHVPEASHFLGDDGFALFSELRQRVALQAAAACGPVVPAASLLSWISGSAAAIDAGGASDAAAGGTSGAATSGTSDAGGELRSYDWRRDATHGTFAPHVDQANQSDYDISALLYLSTFGVDFHGGLFAFNDTDCDRLVEPKAGRLLAFSSGFENLHQVRPVHSGERLVLSVWFRREGGSRVGLQGQP